MSFVIAAAGILLASRSYGQTGQFFDEFGASPKSIAMGQAFTAVADDFSAAYYNPAGLTQLTSPMEVTLGYYYAKPRAKAKIEFGPNRDDMPRELSEQMSSHGAIIGIASDLDIQSLIEAYPWFRRLAFGLVFWLNLPEMLSYDTGPEPYRPHFFRYDEGFALMSMVYAMSCEITPWLSAGAGFFLSQKTYSRQEIFSALNRSTYLDQILPFPAPGFEPDEVIGSRLSIWSKAEAYIVPVAGILLKPPAKELQDRISFGIAWRAKSKSHHARGPLIANLGIEGPWLGADVPPGQPWDLYLPGFGQPPHFVQADLSSVVGFQPTQVTVALAGSPLEGLVLSVDATWKDYSKYVDYSDERPDPPFEDTIVPRVGLEYAFAPGFSSRWLKWIERVALRGGYYFEPTPVRDINKGHNILDTDMDVFSTGLQFDFRSRQGRLHHRFETYFQAHVLRERYVSNDQDPFFGPITLDGDVLSFGASMTTRF